MEARIDVYILGVSMVPDSELPLYQITEIRD